jgi:Fuc2NAc and GlcNAc transferase
MIYGFLLIMVFTATWAGTWLLRKYALSRSLMDIPNERSAHSVPVPRGGGVSIVLALMLVLPVLTLLGSLPGPELIAMLGAGMVVAVIGFVDDHGHIPARWRLLGHFMAAAWVLFWFDGVPPIELFGVLFEPGWIAGVFGTVALVWMLNLYNFMDGIDGLACAEAISVCLGGSLLYWMGDAHELIWAPLMLSVAVAGFLCWNYPPARIFMGDAGSGFLGIIIGAMVLQAAWSKPELLWSWLILLGVFIVDATWTLVRRLIGGCKIYEAHSSHGYQKAARRWGHKKVTGTVVYVNVLFLLPVSILVQLGYLSAVAGIFWAYLPLVFIAYLLKAGQV